MGCITRFGTTIGGKSGYFFKTTSVNVAPFTIATDAYSPTTSIYIANYLETSSNSGLHAANPPNINAKFMEFPIPSALFFNYVALETSFDMTVMKNVCYAKSNENMITSSSKLMSGSSSSQYSEYCFYNSA